MYRLGSGITVTSCDKHPTWLTSSHTSDLTCCKWVKDNGTISSNSSPMYCKKNVKFEKYKNNVQFWHCFTCMVGIQIAVECIRDYIFILYILDHYRNIYMKLCVHFLMPMYISLNQVVVFFVCLCRKSICLLPCHQPEQGHVVNCRESVSFFFPSPTKRFAVAATSATI